MTIIYEAWAAGNRTITPADIGMHILIDATLGTSAITVPEDASEFPTGAIKFTKRDAKSNYVQLICEGTGAYLNQHTHIVLPMQNDSVELHWTGFGWFITDHTSAHQKGVQASGIHRTVIASNTTGGFVCLRSEINGVTRVLTDDKNMQIVLPSLAEIGGPLGEYPNTCSVGVQHIEASNPAYYVVVSALDGPVIYPGGQNTFYIPANARGKEVWFNTDGHQWNLMGTI